MSNVGMSAAAGWVIIVFMAALATLIIAMMISGRIDLRMIISEESGKASLSRLQFLIFTFVIAMGLLVVILKGNAFPSLPDSVYALLGISGGSYLASKIAQKSTEGERRSSKTGPIDPNAVG